MIGECAAKIFTAMGPAFTGNRDQALCARHASSKHCAVPGVRMRGLRRGRENGERERHGEKNDSDAEERHRGIRHRDEG